MENQGFSTGQVVAIGVAALLLGAGAASAYFIMTSDEPAAGEAAKLPAGK